MQVDQLSREIVSSGRGNVLNLKIARRLDEVAQILSEQGANRYRVQAYRNAAANLRRLPKSADEIFKEGGEPGLRNIPAIGPRLARAIAALLLTGRLPILDRLRGESDSGRLLRSVPGIGKALAARLHDELEIETLEQLEAAAHDGRLRELMGLGEKRIAGIMDSLASRLGRLQLQPALGRSQEPSVAEVLDVDCEYREKAAAGQLRTIAPRRFNPNREAWLPILHTQRGQRHYSAFFSNTAHAHAMNKTKDWVVIYYDDAAGERQCTVITSGRGPLTGKRIVPGREEDCSRYYKKRKVELQRARDGAIDEATAPVR